jgi:hypothetical protein
VGDGGTILNGDCVSPICTYTVSPGEAPRRTFSPARSDICTRRATFAAEGKLTLSLFLLSRAADVAAGTTVRAG